MTVLELSHEAAEGSGAQGADDPVDEWGGRIPLMVTEHEIQSKTLTDRKGQVHRIERSSAGDKTVVW